MRHLGKAGKDVLLSAMAAACDAALLSKHDLHQGVYSLGGGDGLDDDAAFVAGDVCFVPPKDGKDASAAVRLARVGMGDDGIFVSIVHVPVSKPFYLLRKSSKPG